MSSIKESDRELFDSIADNYVRKDLRGYSRTARKLRLKTTLKNIPVPVGSILEIGCGGGFSAQYLNGQFNRYLGVDHSEKLITYARKYHRRPGVAFVCTDIDNFKTVEKFDVILMIGVLHHLTEVGEVVDNLKPFLKESGVIIVNEPQKGNVVIALLRKLRKLLDARYSSDQVEFSGKELEELFTRHGYRVSSFCQGFFSTPLAESLVWPDVIGTPMVLLAKLLDPAAEKFLAMAGLGKLTWNIVVEARPER
jgi:SAM-dependent methyltransferase